MKNLIFSALLSTVTISLVVTPGQAATIISPVSATASSEFNSSVGISNTIDQSGLSVTFNSGVDDFDAYIAQNPTHSPLFVHEWFSSENVRRQIVTYDLGAIYAIDRLALWNEEANGIPIFNILTSTDGITFSTIATNLSPIDNPRDARYPVEIFNFSTTTAQFVRFEMTDCTQPNPVCSIGEVAFSAVPEPLTILGASAALGFGSFFKCKVFQQKNKKKA